MRTGLLLSRLAAVRPVGANRWLARCPAHQDRSPSLSIRTAGARTLFHCHAGCDPDDILAAVGLSWRELYADDPWRAAEAQGIAHAGHQHRRQVLRRELHNGIDMDVERAILRICAADLRVGKVLSPEDRGRLEVARERIRAAEGDAA